MTDRILAGRRALVTGGTSGIGEGVAMRLSQAGAAVTIVGRNEDAGARIVGRLRDMDRQAHFVACDVSKPDAVEAMVGRAVDLMGGLDAMVCSAGTGVYEPITEVDVDAVRKVFDVNILGLMWCAKYAVPHLERGAHERGHPSAVVNVSSVHSLASSSPDAPYAATKGAIDAFTRSASLDHAPHVRFNTVQPGWIESALTKKIWKQLGDGDADKARDAIAAEQPMERMGEPDDVGHACAYLLSDGAGFVTGASLLVDGGLTAVLEKWSAARVAHGTATAGA